MKKILTAALAVLLTVSLSACGDLVKLTEDGGKLIDSQNGITYVGAPVCFEPATLEEVPYAKCRAMKMEYYGIVGQSTDTWISEPFNGIGGLYYAEGAVALPSLAEFAPSQVIVCVEDTITVGLAIISDKADAAAVAAAFTEGEPTSIVQSGVSYKLKFSSDKEEYAGIYYNLIYVEGDDGENYIYDRSTKTCVNVGDVLQKYLPRPTEG